MEPTADQLADSLSAAWELLASAFEDGWSDAAPGARAMVTGVEVSTLNGVWVTGTGADSKEVAGLLERVAQSGVPYCLQMRPGCDPQLVQLAQQKGLELAEEVPLMAIAGEQALACARLSEPPALRIRALEPAEAELHASVAAAGFEAPEEIFHALVRPSMLELPGVRCYVGELDGEAVVTGVGVREVGGDGAAIFNIATPPVHRGRGYASAITARAVRDALIEGARWVWLQSSASGYGVYERLGFVTQEAWPCFITAGPEE